MQNKGFVKLFAAALILVCAFYLSFNFVTNYYEKESQEYAKGEYHLQQRYLDSIANEPVWFGYTLKQCREKEIGLGLDLKGGMNVILEVSVPDILKVLSDYNTSEHFNNAITAAKVRQQKGGGNFLTLFKEEYEKIDANAKLSTIFISTKLGEGKKISLNNTNQQVIDILQGEVESALGNSFNVLRTRIDRFGVVQPNIQQIQGSEGRILVELPGIKEPERVRKLLQGSANLEFWETYNASELMASISQANEIVRSIKAASLKADAAVAVADVDETKAELQAVDSLAASLKADAAEDNTKAFEEFKKNNPLVALLNFQGGNGPILGTVLSSDTAEVNKYLNLKQVKEVLPVDLKLSWTVKSIDPNAKQLFYQLIALRDVKRNGRPSLDGDAITDARIDFDQFTNRTTVNMKMDEKGADIWARLTRDNIGKSVAIVLDGYVYSFPTVQNEIKGGSSQISGNFSVEEAKDLANVLNSGKMPAPAHIVQEDVVGPSLGQEAIDKGLSSFLIAFGLVLVYMIFYYGRIPGLVADFALIMNIFFLFGILASFGSVLTLPGIAGIVLTMGMAVDANVLIYERIREEMKAGKNLKKAVADGYSNAFSAILDSNVTTILVGIILFYFGSGSIQGFAVTLIVGILTSFFTSVFFTRMIFERILASEKDRNIPFTTSFTKNWFQNANIDFVKLRKVGYIISGVVIAIAIFSLATAGLKQGIDFSGGRNYIVKFEKAVNPDDIRSEFTDVFPDAQTSVITMGSENQIRVTTNYLINSLENSTDSVIVDKLFAGLSKYIDNSQVTRDLFSNGYAMVDGKPVASVDTQAALYGVQSSQKVEGSVADDIKISAVWAITIALIVIGLYILVRFRNYAFSVGAIASLVHDVLFILGIYSVFYQIMPFSLEIDQSFIAAILTIFGYSINDTVVIFDRVRENIGLYPKRSAGEQINNSLNATLSRTFSTTISTAIVLLAIFIFGGEVIRGFVFALLVGVSVGVYSTLFIAAPVAYEIQNKQQKKNKN